MHDMSTENDTRHQIANVQTYLLNRLQVDGGVGQGVELAKGSSDHGPVVLCESQVEPFLYSLEGLWRSADSTHCHPPLHAPVDAQAAAKSYYNKSMLWLTKKATSLWSTGDLGK